MALDDNALVTLAAQKVYMKKTDSDDDSLLEVLINSVSDFFDAYVRFQLKQKTYTNLYLDGNGAVELWLPFYPVADISSVIEIDSIGTEETLTEGKGNDYIVYEDKGLLVRRDENWVDDYKSIKIPSCKGGFATIPDELQLACKQQVAVEYQRLTKKEWGETSRSFPDGSVTTTIEENLLPYVEEVLKRYRRILI